MDSSVQKGLRLQLIPTTTSESNCTLKSRFEVFPTPGLFASLAKQSAFMVSVSLGDWAEGTVQEDQGRGGCSALVAAGEMGTEISVWQPWTGSSRSAVKVYAKQISMARIFDRIEREPLRQSEQSQVVRMMDLDAKAN